jgi:hypothetical protein
MKTQFKYFFVLNILFLYWSLDAKRSPLRTQDKYSPRLSVRWADEPQGKTHTMSDSHIEEYPIFTIFNKEKFETNLLPQAAIPFRDNAEMNVDGKTLSDLCQELVDEVFHKKRRFTNFTIIQNKNFSRRHKCGLLVVKFKNYPFVVKLFIEDPKTFINYWWKGFEPVFFWNMGRGAGRHLSGLTRIENRKNIEKHLAFNPFKDVAIEIPRKWFWTPQNNRFIHIDGYNIGNGKTLSTQLPSIYAIIADAIDTKHETILSHEQTKHLSIELCNHLDLIVDPHATNFVFKQCPQTNALKIIIIDTEYFPLIVGLKEKKKFKSYEEWYLFLSGKCFKDMFCRTKYERRRSYLEPNIMAFQYT